MSFSPTDSTLYGSLFREPQIAALFSDEQYVRQLLHVEAALANAQARLGVIPHHAAQMISAAADNLEVDFDALRRGIERDGFPIIELVKQLREHAGTEAASWVHWGATTQDIMDTALVLQVRNALIVIEARLVQIIRHCASLADRHRHTLMAGRTHTQHALPITFGYKVATWFAPLLRHHARLRELRSRVLIVQFGGAVGTLASLGQKGMDVQAELARELELNVPLMPWHTQRDSWAELAGWLSTLSGSLAKMGQDVLLLAQTEIGEVRESDDPSRGGSSTMPQKSNPIVSELIVAAARTNASLLSSVHHALIQEHERGTSGWQMEWLALPQMIALTSGALDKAVFLGEQLAVDTTRMQENVKASQGLMLAEMLTFALSEHVSRTEAKALVQAAVRQAVEQQRNLVDVTRELTDAPINWEVMNERYYLGASEVFVDRVLAAAQELSP